MSTAQDAPAAASDEPQFETRLDPRWALSLEQVLVVAIFGVLFVALSYIPLRASDLWGHVAYGQWILDHRRLPTEDPAMPLARGMQVVDTAWLSQVILGACDRYLGPESISHLFAALGLVTYVMWTRIFYLLTGRLWLSLLGMLLLIFVAWSRFATVRPESFAILCGALVYWIVARRLARADAPPTTGAKARPIDWPAWIGIPLIFAAWANLHGSFVVGWLVLGCFFLGRVLELLWQSRSVVAVLRDRDARSWLWLTELAIVATLLNPYGIDLWINTLRFASNPNLATVTEWQPLKILGVGGRPFAISILLLLVVWRHSRRPVRPAEVLLLLVFAAATINGIRMIGWYAPAFVFVLMPHVAEIVNRWWPRRIAAAVEDPPVDNDKIELATAKLPLPGYSFRYSLVALLLIWIAFAFSPLSQRLLRPKNPRPPASLYEKSSTPLALTQFLGAPPADNPLARPEQWSSQVFHPQLWGDWLDRAGPPAFQPFVTSNIHLVPRQVWSDYNRITDVRSGWERTLDRYQIGTVIVDKKEQASLLGAMRRNTDWQNVYEDDTAAVFVVRSKRTRESQNAEAPAEENS